MPPGHSRAPIGLGQPAAWSPEEDLERETEQAGTNKENGFGMGGVGR